MRGARVVKLPSEKECELCIGLIPVELWLVVRDLLPTGVKRARYGRRWAGNRGRFWDHYAICYRMLFGHLVENDANRYTTDAKAETCLVSLPYQLGFKTGLKWQTVLDTTLVNVLDIWDIIMADDLVLQSSGFTKKSSTILKCALYMKVIFHNELRFSTNVHKIKVRKLM